VTGRLTGDARQVKPADAEQEILEVALAEQANPRGPVLVTGPGQLIEVAAVEVGSERERPRERLGTNVARSRMGTLIEDDAIEEAVHSIGGIGSRTAMAGLSHHLHLIDRNPKSQIRNPNPSKSVFFRVSDFGFRISC